MKTTTMSRILLTCLLAPLLAYAIYALFGPYLIWGILIAVLAFGLLVWVWKPVIFKSDSEPQQ